MKMKMKTVIITLLVALVGSLGYIRLTGHRDWARIGMIIETSDQVAPISKAHDLNTPEMKAAIADIEKQIPTVQTVAAWDARQMQAADKYAGQIVKAR